MSLLAHVAKLWKRKDYTGSPPIVFEISLLHCYDDPIVLRRFAEAICQQATHDRNRLTDADEYKAKVRKALSMFERTNTPRGIKSLLDALPDEYAFASLAQECWESLCRTDPNFFNPKESIAAKTERLRDLADYPEKFMMAGRVLRSRCSSVLQTCIEKFFWKCLMSSLSVVYLLAGYHLSTRLL